MRRPALALVGGYVLGLLEDDLAHRAEWRLYLTALMFAVAVGLLVSPAVKRLAPGGCTK